MSHCCQLQVYIHVHSHFKDCLPEDNHMEFVTQCEVCGELEVVAHRFLSTVKAGGGAKELREV